jgi:hypothetical protein
MAKDSSAHTIQTRAVQQGKTYEQLSKVFVLALNIFSAVQPGSEHMNVELGLVNAAILHVLLRNWFCSCARLVFRAEWR